MAVSWGAHLKSPDAEDMEERKSIFSLHLPPAAFATRERERRAKCIFAYSRVVPRTTYVVSRRRKRRRRVALDRSLATTTTTFLTNDAGLVVLTGSDNGKTVVRAIIASRCGLVEISFARLIRTSRENAPCDDARVTDMRSARLNALRVRERFRANRIPLRLTDEK
ncbi:unnamed protein product [Lasius platythorax]|uniref:Uncharacterized protein n=1 Tax=Lasius platythorax TaxID=488582 RepID=A0AAV2P7T1_9HYME